MPRIDCVFVCLVLLQSLAGCFAPVSVVVVDSETGARLTNIRIDHSRLNSHSPILRWHTWSGKESTAPKGEVLISDYRGSDIIEFRKDGYHPTRMQLTNKIAFVTWYEGPWTLADWFPDEFDRSTAQWIDLPRDRRVEIRLFPIKER